LRLPLSVQCGFVVWAPRITLVGMQPPEYPTGPIGPPAAVPGPAGPVAAPSLPPPVEGKRPNRRLRLWLAMGGGILALLCLGGVGVFVSLYDGATAIKRSEPDAVADSFLRAYLVDRDDQEVALYTCKAGSDLTAIAALRTELVNREKQFGVKVNVSWGTLTVSGTTADKRSVSTNLTISGTKDGETLSRRIETWAVAVVDEDGWRVCGASKTS
jgi:hypothetical protein